ncbi:unnamed protein product, partial [Iphiclides podalirius]
MYSCWHRETYDLIFDGITKLEVVLSFERRLEGDITELLEPMKFLKAGRRYNRIAGAHEVSVSLAKRWFCALSGDKSSWKLVDLVS